MTTFTFKNREEYLALVAQWKVEYAALSQEIRLLKLQRKPYRYEYRPKGNTAAKKRTRIGDNPAYDTSTAWKLPGAREKAREMLEVREAAKAQAKAQKEAQRALAA